MYLRKIISSGFKSFADKVSITLDKDHITGIVGPNGAGKSNVIDAVRWVMGEQNAKMLRGEKATDIIFAGSQKRKALGMAEVSLVFDNSTASSFCPPQYRHEPEIELTRRIYADGEREYFINRKPARLKDVVSFFAASGLGGRSYSMIQQGQVDRILRAKPEQIREIIEEAAGISLFKERKEETEKKLEATQLNLARLGDIQSEISRQMFALKEQVEKAEQWKTLSERLRTQELTLFAHNFRFFSERIIALRSAMAQLEALESQVVGKLATLEQEYDQKRKVLEEADPELQHIHEQVIAIREQMARSESELLHSKAQYDSAAQQLQEMAQNWQSDEQNYKRLKGQSDESARILEESESSVEGISVQIESLSERAEIIDEELRVYIQQIDRWREEKHRLQTSIDSRSEKRTHLKKELSNCAREKLEFEQKLSQLDEELSTTDIMAEAIRVKINLQRRNVDFAFDQKAKLEAAIVAQEKKIKQVKEIYEVEKDKLLSNKVKLSTLEEIEQNSDLLSTLVRKFKAESPRILDFKINVLTEVVALSDHSSILPQSVIASFEKWGERLLIEDPNHIPAISQFVTEQKWGLISASYLNPKTEHAALQKFAGEKGLTSFADLLSYDKENTALSHFLQQIYYVPDANQDLSYFYESSDFSCAVFFLSNGQIITGSGQFWLGDSGSLSDGALSRAKQMETLRTMVAALTAKVEDCLQNCQKAQQEFERLKKEAVQNEQQLGQSNKLAMELVLESKNLEQKLALKQEQTEEVRIRYTQIVQRSDEVAANLEDLESEYFLLKKDLEDAQLHLREAQDESSHLNEEREEVRRQLEDRKMQLTKAQTRAETLREHYLQDQEQLQRLEAGLGQKKQQHQGLVDKIAQEAKRSEELQGIIKELLLARESYEEELDRKKEANTDLVGDMRKLETQQKEQREILNKTKKEQNEANLDLERTQMALDGVRTQSLEKYHLEISGYDVVIQENFKSKETQNEIQKIRTKLEGFGAVNMMAIDEYKTLNARNDFLNEQKAEVLQTIDVLNSGINEMLDKSLQQYMDTYNTLNVEFANLFPILFPTGEAKLHMLDPSAPLDSGVEIMVRLPGKSQQNMTLFSGGERALIAIALIFALLKSKPTPFCFLDEVDAPLDETNVARYNKVLEILSDRFQFIVITHRRRTMEVLDTLYGVTMQEPGVSKVVGVDMTQALPEHLKKAVSNETKRQGASALP